MHKYFIKQNILTERPELYKSNNIFVNSLSTENVKSMEKIKSTIQNLYNHILFIKEKTENDEFIDQLCKIELLVSNLYYSFFSSPLQLPEKNSTTMEVKELLTKAVELSKNLIEDINIPEQNRIAYLINLNLQDLLNKLITTNN